MFVCDLCNSSDYSVLIETSSNTVMRSDRAIVKDNLVKVECQDCGLVSSFSKSTTDNLIEFYTQV